MIKPNHHLLEKRLLILWVIANLLLGVWVVNDYGISADEPAYYFYAEKSVDAYKSNFGQLYEPDYGPSNHRYYGPAFIMAVEGILRIVKFLAIQIDPVQFWHFSYFVLFQLTGLCLYALTKRWFSTWSAWGVLVIFITQPLLWGHSFINPKDIPFMFFFTLSIFLGFRMVDPLSEHSPVLSKDTFKPVAVKWFQIAPIRRRNFLLAILFFSIGLAISIIYADGFIENIIRYLYSAEPGSWAGKFMDSLSANLASLPLDNYVHKAKIQYARIEKIFFCVLFLGIGTYLVYPLIKFPSYSLKSDTRLPLLRFIQENLLSPKIILAGLALGITTSIRVIGPLAGLIVIAFLFTKDKRKFMPVSFGYFLWASITVYLTWPFLWLAPISRFIETLKMMSQFPWQGQVLFNGVFYDPPELPRSYLPVLMNIQFTEVFTILFYIGLIIFLWRLFNTGIKTDLFLLICLGGIFPILGIITIKSPMYDNFRQFLFLVPALFICTAFVFDAVFKQINKTRLRGLLIAVIAFTGIWHIIQLHPYEYIYYNSFVGGVEGAFRRFELDYWQTSTRELSLALNEIASADDKIIVQGSLRIIRFYIRPDLFFERNGAATFNINGEYDYAVLFSRWNDDQHYPAAEIEKIVERNGAILGVVKQVRGESFE